MDTGAWAGAGGSEVQVSDNFTQEAGVLSVVGKFQHSPKDVPPWLEAGGASQAPILLLRGEVEGGGEWGASRGILPPFSLPGFSHQRLRIERVFSGARSQLHLA